MTIRKIVEEAVNEYRNSLINKRKELLYGYGPKVGLPFTMREVDAMVLGFNDGIIKAIEIIQHEQETGN